MRIIVEYQGEEQWSISLPDNLKRATFSFHKSGTVYDKEFVPKEIECYEKTDKA